MSLSIHDYVGRVDGSEWFAPVRLLIVDPGEAVWSSVLISREMLAGDYTEALPGQTASFPTVFGYSLVPLTK